MNNVILLLQRARLALQEFGPSMALLTLPGGYLIALTGWIYRHRSLSTMPVRKPASASPVRTAASAAAAATTATATATATAIEG